MSKATSTRVAVSLPLELAILVDKECERLGIGPTQFLRAAAYEKAKRTEQNDYTENFEKIWEKMDQMENLMKVIVKAVSK